MRKVIVIASFIAILANTAHSQGITEEKLAAKISELTKMGIDTIMVYGPTTGRLRLYADNSPCYLYHDERYLLWIHKKHNYITLVDECYKYKVLKDKVEPIANFLATHLSEVAKQDIRAPAYKTIRNGKEELGRWTTSDDMRFKLTFYIKGHPFVKSFGAFELTDQYGPAIDGEERPLNIYYEQNQKSCIKMANDIMSKTLLTLKFEKI